MSLFPRRRLVQISRECKTETLEEIFLVMFLMTHFRTLLLTFSLPMADAIIDRR